MVPGLSAPPCPPRLRSPGGLAHRLAACAAASLAGLALAGPVPAPPWPRVVAPAAYPTQVPAWDCWVDGAQGSGIRCIADRDLPSPLPEPYTDDDEAAEALLELVHGHLHRGNTRRANELVGEVSHLLRRGDLWTIRLSAPPLESSWADSRPQGLVRALLCRGNANCAVTFHR